MLRSNKLLLLLLYVMVCYTRANPNIQLIIATVHTIIIIEAEHNEGKTISIEG